MKKESIIETLTAFNERVDRVLKFSFTEQLKAEGFGIQVKSRVDEPTTVDSRFPSPEAMDAFANNYRLFVQNNDSISIGNIAKIYNDPLVPKSLAERFNNSRQTINGFLDSPSALQEHSRRELMETILYGEISHTNKKYQAQVKKWKAREPLWSMAYLDFLKTAAQMLKFLSWIRHRNQEVIGELQK